MNAHKTESIPLQWYLKQVQRAIKDFALIEPGDRITVGVSGGKDSIALLYLLSRLQKYTLFQFELFPVYIDLGWQPLNLVPGDLSSVQSYCQSLDLNLTIETTQIAEIVFQVREEKNPCSLCAKLRRGALHNTARKLNCNKVALGHHGDDAVETFLLNLFYTGKLGTFSPRTYLSKKNLVLIRPLVYLGEQNLQNLVQKLALPTFVNPCPVNGHTQRQKVKEILHYLEKIYPDLRSKTVTALGNHDLNSDWVPQSKESKE